MADVRDWGAFIRGRWDWTRHGYERGFPRGCQFTDVDAVVEFDGRALVIEPKHHDGESAFTPPRRGQLLFLESEAAAGKTVFVLYGCAGCNSPQGLYDVGTGRWHDWRGRSLGYRRDALKAEIDRAMGVEMGGAA